MVLQRPSQRCQCCDPGRALTCHRLPDRVGMTIAGGAQKLKKDAHDLGISADEKVQADRGLAGFFSALASDGRAAALGVYSQVTGLPDSMGMNIAGAHKK